MSARKRFWAAVDVGAEGALFAPRLDGRSIRLPKGAVLAVRSIALAEAIAGEWRGIGENAAFTPDELPLTRMSGTMIERVRPDPEASRDALARYGMDDELCYRGAPDRGDGVARVFDWAAQQGLYPVVTDTLMPVSQPKPYLTALRTVLAERDETVLTVLGVIVQASGSLLLGLCLVGGGISVAEACAIACADEAHQLAVWGQDNVLQATIDQRSEDLRLAMEYLALSQV